MPSVVEALPITDGRVEPAPARPVWAMTRLSDQAAVEDRQQRRWADKLGTPLLCHYGEREAEGDRLVVR